MTVLIAVLVVGAGSLVFRLVPLLTAQWIPARLTALAGWGGLGVLAAITVRAVLHQQDASVPAARLVAAVSVGVGLVLVGRRGSVLLGVAGCASVYLGVTAISALVAR